MSLIIMMIIIIINNYYYYLQVYINELIKIIFMYFKKDFFIVFYIIN